MKDYELNFYRSMKLKNAKYLLTVDSGDWIAISSKKFDLLKKNKIDQDIMLFNILKDKYIVLTDENKDEYADKLRLRYSHIFSTASLHIVAITKRCNHDCLYCHANAKMSNDKKLDMDEKTAKKTVDFIFNSPNNNICIEFQGGEPLINFDIIKYIIEYSLEINIKYHKELKFALVTNLTLMDEEKLEFLMKHRVGLCTSLDGTKEIHDKNRQYIDGKGTYDNVINWIKKIKEDHKYPLEALMVTTMHSLKYPKEIIDEYMKFGFDHIQFRPMLNLGNAKNNDEMNV
ncbi:radical SAM protein, partial [Candidatus Woesearchaeota archaeon]|nr:radical SAM protein [Candidatus Woesearchaeota archaeon]